ISLAFLLIIIISAIIIIPKSTWKKIFSGNNFATVFISSDTVYNRAVYRNWTAHGNAWGENVGWLTFSPNSNSTVYVADDSLSGYLYGENIGWISLSCRNTDTCSSGVNYGVSNDAEGNLSGFAYGENIGWIDFGTSTAEYQVKISNAGVFSGYAYGENVGWINFGIDAYSATTTWTPRSTRAECDDGIDNDNNGKIDYPDDPNCSSLTDNTESPSTKARARSVATTTNGEGGDTDTSSTTSTTASTTLALATTTATTTKPKDNVLTPINTVEVPVIIPQKLALQDLPIFSNTTGSDSSGKTSFTFAPTINTFLEAPLPEEITTTLDKSQELKDYFATVGLIKIQDFASLSRKPIAVSSTSSPVSLFTVSNGTTTIRTYITNDANNQMIQLVRVASGTPLTISFTPTDINETTGTWNNKNILFISYGNQATFKLTAPSLPGKYYFTSQSSPLSLVIEVLNIQPIQNNPATWVSKVLRWLGL
ncbi:MAG: hypothetical protein NTV98_06140, partial [Candidatus Roizmanbacteria bacterium]|nr:hypothetical protein [Candidatus Roizmanbacteria bacterium]